jgi:hypothetical protein
MTWNKSSTATPTVVQIQRERVRDRREHCERHRDAWALALPTNHRGDHDAAPDPGGDDDENQADVIEWAARQWRIKCEEHRGAAGKRLRIDPLGERRILRTELRWASLVAVLVVAIIGASR